MAIAETPRMQQLRRLASAVPGQNQKVATGLQEAQKTQLQAQLGAAKPGVGGPQAAQQVGAQAAGQAGQIALQAQQQGQKELAQVGQLGLAQMGQEATQRLGAQERGLSQSARRLELELSKISQSAKNEIVDKQNQFRVDSAGQQLLNERQLADWAVLKARSEEELKNYAQIMDQSTQREIQYYQTMHRKVLNALKSGYDAEGNKLDMDSRAGFMEYAQWLEKKEMEKAAKRSAQAQIFGAVGTIAGAAIGGYLGAGAGGIGAGPGAAAGGAIGGGAGTAVGAATS